MTRDTPAPRVAPLGAVQTRLGNAGDVASATTNYTTAALPGISQSICPRCGHPGPHTPGPGVGPHYARLVCGACGRFLRWLPRPRPAEEVRP